MSQEEQIRIQQKYYTEAMRYMDNAKESLKRAGKEEKHYTDDKYVKTACGTAYSAVLKALDGYLSVKSVAKSRGRKSIFYYQDQLAKLDKKLLRDLNDAYEILHLTGYYDGNTNVSIIQTGLNVAYDIIYRIKPEEKD